MAKSCPVSRFREKRDRERVRVRVRERERERERRTFLAIRHDEETPFTRDS
jgi:hypothetical protein